MDLFTFLNQSNGALDIGLTNWTLHGVINQSNDALDIVDQSNGSLHIVDQSDEPIHSFLLIKWSP